MAGWVAAGGRGTFPPFLWLLRLKGHSWHTRCMTAPNNESSVMTQNQTQNKNLEIETAKSLPRRDKLGPIHESNISSTLSGEIIKMLSQAKTNFGLPISIYPRAASKFIKKIRRPQVNK